MTEPKTSQFYLGTGTGVAWANGIGAMVDAHTGVRSGTLDVGLGATLLDKFGGPELAVRFQPDPKFALTFKVAALWQLPDDNGCGMGCGKKLTGDGVETKPLALSADGYGSHDGSRITEHYSIFDNASAMWNIGFAFRIYKGLELAPSMGMIGADQPFAGITVGGSFGL